MKSSSSPSWYILALILLNITSVSGDQTIPSGLFWTNFSVQTADGSFLVQEWSGFVRNGHICGVLGPSGAGKSTTLTAFAGAISQPGSLTVNGNITYYDAETENGDVVGIDTGRVAWLQQQDSFFSMLTVKETLEMAAFLELPHFTERQRQAQVRATMDSLGLRSVEHRAVGDPSIMHKGGLSGGEQRRLSLARELISSPKLFIGDEPTSGLDSTMSEKVIKLIKELVKQRDIPCMLSLHQPRSSIFRMLDEVLLMAPGGRVCYHGNSREAVEYFRKLGYSCPGETNPAEFLVDLVSIDAEDPSAAPEDELRISRLADAFQEHQHKAHNAVFSTVTNVDVDDECKAVGSSIRERPRFLAIRRFRRLLLRSWRQNIRNNRVNFFRLMGSAGNAFLFSTIFKSVKKGEFTPKSVGDRVAMLTFGIINMSMLALLKTVDLFSKEKPVVQREQLRRQYSSFEYLLSKLVAEIPLDVAFAGIFTTVLKLTSGIRTGWKALTGTFALMTVSGASLGFAIGAMSPSAETAMSTAASIMVILMSVGVINPSGVDVSEPQPVFVEALKQVSPINFAVKAMCLTEYKDMEFSSYKGRQNIFLRGRTILKDLPKMGGLALVQNGNQVLYELGLDKDTYGGCMRHLALLSLSNLVISWIGLQMQNGPEIAKSF